MLRLPAKQLARTLLSISGVLILLHLLLQWARLKLGYANETVNLTIALFDVDLETSIPTWYSQILWLIAAAYAWIIASFPDREKHGKNKDSAKQWHLVTFILLYLSMDEGAAIHETTNSWAYKVFGEGVSIGPLTFTDWVLVGMTGIAIILLILMGWIRSLPNSTKQIFALGVTTYLLGAVVVETLHWNILFLQNQTSYAAHVSTAIEEGLEMAGTVIAIYALADYAQRRVKKIEIELV